MALEPNDPVLVTHVQRPVKRRGEDSVVVTLRVPLRVREALERYRDIRHLRTTAEACREVLEEFSRLVEKE